MKFIKQSTQQREKRKDKEGGLSLPSLSEKSKLKSELPRGKVANHVSKPLLVTRSVWEMDGKHKSTKLKRAFICNYVALKI